MIYFNNSTKAITVFAFGNVLMKAVPCYTLREVVVKTGDVVASGVMFGVYNMWLYMNHENLYLFYKKLSVSIMNNTYESPIMWFLNYF